MAKLTIPAGDWSGEMVDIIINESKKTFRLDGELYNLEFIKDDGFESVIVRHENNTQEFCSGHFSGNEWYINEMGIEREHSNPYVAAAQMVRNLI